MGQKTNSNILRLGIKNNLEWDIKYFEKNINEASFLIHNINEIKKFINRFFKINNLIIHQTKINYNQDQLDVFISYFITIKAIKQINKFNKQQNLTIKPKKKKKSKKFKKKFKKKYSKKNPTFKKRLYMLAKIKELMNKKNFIYYNNFSEYILESLNTFTNNSLNINITLQNLNKGLSTRLSNSKSKNFRNMIFKLRKFSNNKFFRESINVFIISFIKPNSSKFLATYISSQIQILNRHNYFLKFFRISLMLLLKSKLSKIKGIKIAIKGRINGTPRAKLRIINIGKLPLQSFKNKITYFQDTAYTNNGTFGIKVWICEK